MYTETNHFNWMDDNYGATLTETGQGTSVSSHASANTKGTNTALMTGIAEHAYGISIILHDGDTVATVRRHLVDILIDPAAGVGNAGSSWSVKIANLIGNGASISNGLCGASYYFPIYIPAGTAIGCAYQDLVGGSTVRVSVRVYGRPSRMDLVKVGHFVQTFGADTSTTAGTSITLGNSGTQGSYTASLGTTTRNSWWWQMGNATNDNSLVTYTAFFDVAANASNKIICGKDFFYSQNTAEQSGKSAMGLLPPIQNVGAGEDVYVRGYIPSATPDSGNTVIVYAVS